MPAFGNAAASQLDQRHAVRNSKSSLKLQCAIPLHRLCGIIIILVASLWNQDVQAARD